MRGIERSQRDAEPVGEDLVAEAHREQRRVGVQSAGDDIALAGFDGIPSWTQRQGDLYAQFSRSLAACTPDFQTRLGYPVSAPGKANLTMSTNQLAERFGCTSMTLEMPFKDNDDAPNLRTGWSGDRSKQLGKDVLSSVADIVGRLR